jgi:hypothetical protein
VRALHIIVIVRFDWVPVGHSSDLLIGGAILFELLHFLGESDGLYELLVLLTPFLGFPATTGGARRGSLSSGVAWRKAILWIRCLAWRSLTHDPVASLHQVTLLLFLERALKSLIDMYLLSLYHQSPCHIRGQLQSYFVADSD